MPSAYTPSGTVGTSLQEATVGEATGTHGTTFMRNNIETIGNKIRFLNDDGTIADETLIAPTLLNSWVDFGSTVATSAYYKDRSGCVHLRGSVKNGTTTSGTTLFTLPSGYRPSATVYFFVPSGSGAASGVMVGVNSGGTVFINSTGASATILALDAISFRAI